ncbi:copper resistance D family protein [Effusibacillus consociatus]|uniref:Copper resistance D family protein n=1 Tax=Effusibacillus consociatus TaxID=1117041 RepID=A0ABV9Q775_9BACL
MIGGLISSLVPKGKMPKIHIPKALMLLCVLAVAVLSFFPVLKIIVYFADDLGIWTTVNAVLFSFETGKAWLWTLGLSASLFAILLTNNLNESPKALLYLSLALVLSMILALAWGGHAASLNKWGGFAAHTAHFLAISVWIGVMFVIGWFRKNQENWLEFLKWYTPLAVVCLFVTIVAGLFMMEFIVPSYFQSWMISYGQALLIKHLLIVPLVTFALINGFLIKRRLQKEPAFDPSKWVRAESIVALAIFGITAYMGQQEPPHTLTPSLPVEQASPWFLTLYQGMFNPAKELGLSFNETSFILGFVALLFLILILLAYLKKIPTYFAVGMSVLFVAAGYLSLMTALQ